MNTLVNPQAVLEAARAHAKVLRDIITLAERQLTHTEANLLNAVTKYESQLRGAKK